MSILKNPRWERFAQELAKGKTADAAYELAGYKASRPHASRLATNGNVKARVAEIQGKAAEKTVVTIETITRQLIEDRQLAQEVRQPGAAVSATTAMAKLHGYMSEKHEHSGPNGGAIQTEDVTLLTPTERQQRLAALLGKAGS